MEQGRKDGCWPDGSRGPKYLARITESPPTGWTVARIAPGEVPDTSSWPPHDLVPVVPLEVANRLAAALSECIDTAEEGWAYASDYFREKWQCEREIGKARTALSHYKQALDGEGT